MGAARSVGKRMRAEQAESNIYQQEIFLSLFKIQHCGDLGAGSACDKQVADVEIAVDDAVREIRLEQRFTPPQSKQVQLL